MRDPANLPALLESFFTIRLMTPRKLSAHTIASYLDTFRLLLQFAQKRLHQARCPYVVKRRGGRYDPDAPPSVNIKNPCYRQAVGGIASSNTSRGWRD
jgi:hypothetical protein